MGMICFFLNGRLQVVDVTDDGREVGLSFILPGVFGEFIIDNLPALSLRAGADHRRCNISLKKCDYACFIIRRSSQK